METSPNDRSLQRKEIARRLDRALKDARCAAIELETLYRAGSPMLERLETVSHRLEPLLMLARYALLYSEDTK